MNVQLVLNHWHIVDVQEMIEVLVDDIVLLLLLQVLIVHQAMNGIAMNQVYQQDQHEQNQLMLHLIHLLLLFQLE
jgi:hypothetical protein